MAASISKVETMNKRKAVQILHSAEQFFLTHTVDIDEFANNDHLAFYGLGETARRYFSQPVEDWILIDSQSTVDSFYKVTSLDTVEDSGNKFMDQSNLEVQRNGYQRYHRRSTTTM